MGVWLNSLTENKNNNAIISAVDNAKVLGIMIEHVMTTDSFLRMHTDDTQAGIEQFMDGFLRAPIGCLFSIIKKDLVSLIILIKRMYVPEDVEGSRDALVLGFEQVVKNHDEKVKFFLTAPPTMSYDDDSFIPFKWED